MIETAQAPLRRLIYEASTGRPQIRSVVAAAVVAASALTLGVSVAFDPAIGLLALAAAVVCIALALNPSAVESALVMALLAGAMVFTYGFSNLGVQTGLFPLPLTEMILFVLLAVAVLDGRFSPSAGVMVPLCLFAGFVALRLIHDFPEYRAYAVRDSTTAVEAFLLIVGYRAMAREGVETWVRRLRFVGVAALAYGSLYPFSDTLQRIGPQVGLQRGIPLLGSFNGVDFAVASIALFFVVYSRGVWRFVFLAWALLDIGMIQSRAVYLAFPVAMLIVGIGLRRPLKMLAGMTVALVLAGGLLFALAGAGVEGRVGSLRPSFYLTHLDTLLGGSGSETAAGTLQDRLKWARGTLRYVESRPSYLIAGVGLGPDLTFGFRQGGDILVRKPHDDYLEVFARLGVIGLALFVWLLVAALRPIARCMRRGDGPESMFCTWVLGSTFVYLFVAATEPLLAFPYGTVPVFLVMGMGLATAERWRRRAQTSGRKVPVLSSP